jgi:hypothetical protein
MTPSLQLDADQHQLLNDLLVKERSELPVEIHHCDSREMKARLRKRLETVDQLLDKLGAATEAGA